MKRDRARMTAKRTLDAAHLLSYMQGCWMPFPAAPATGASGKSRGAEPLLGKPARARSMLHGTSKSLPADLPSTRPSPVLAQVLHHMLPISGVPNTISCDHVIRTSCSGHHARLQITTR